MKLFYSPASPFVRKVSLTAHMKGLTTRITNVSTDATKGDPALNRSNPLGRLPCLVADDGMVIHDSHVICEYLDSLGAGPVLFPRSGAARWQTLTRASLADGILEAALLIVYEKRYRPPEMFVQSWVDRQWGKIHLALAGLEANPPDWTAHPDYGHLALACALGYLDFRHPGSWRDKHPKLVAWLDRFDEAVPGYAATRPVG
jgi:glutathione S-transferase